MNTRKLVGAVIALAVILALAVVLLKLVSGAFSLLSGAVNAVLGIAVVIAMVIIVVWMLSYARRH